MEKVVEKAEAKAEEKAKEKAEAKAEEKAGEMAEAEGRGDGRSNILISTLTLKLYCGLLLLLFVLLLLFGVCCYSWGYAPVDVAWLLVGILLLDLLLFEIFRGYDAQNSKPKIPTSFESIK